MRVIILTRNRLTRPVPYSLVKKTHEWRDYTDELLKFNVYTECHIKITCYDEISQDVNSLYFVYASKPSPSDPKETARPGEVKVCVVPVLLEKPKGFGSGARVEVSGK